MQPKDMLEAGINRNPTAYFMRLVKYDRTN